MMGDKVIGKIFKDNLKDFEKIPSMNENMNPIQNICAIIVRVLVILKELDVRQRAAIES